MRVGLLLLALLLMAAATPPPLVGAVYNLTGSQAPLDVPSARGAELAARTLPLRLVVRDGRSQAGVLQDVTWQLLREDPAALLGLSDTDMVMASAPMAGLRGVPFVTSGATSPRLPAKVPRLFLACFGDNVQAAAAAEFAAQRLGARRVAVLWNADMEYTRLLAAYFSTRFASLGEVAVSHSFPAEGPLPGGLPPVDAVYLAAGPDEAPRLVKALRASGCTVPILGGDSFDSAAFDGPSTFEDVYFTTHTFLSADSPNPRVRAFLQEWAEAYPGQAPDAFAALGYDTVQLVADALRRADSSDPAAVARALEATRSFEGVTGRISYPPGSHVPVKTVSVVRTGATGATLAEEWQPAEVPTP